jgi:hypothetical protein
MPADMYDVEIEGDLEHPRRPISEPADVVACVQGHSG